MEYTREQKNKKQQGNKSVPYLVANQSTKSIKEKVCSSIYTLPQFTKAYKIKKPCHTFKEKV